MNKGLKNIVLSMLFIAASASAQVSDPVLMTVTSPLGSRPLPRHPFAERSEPRGFPKQPSVRCKSKGQNLNSGRLAQPCFWHFGGQRALDHLLGWEREGSTNCTLET